MPKSKKYDHNFQPRSYWGPQEVRTNIAARVKGELRRRQAMNDLEEGHADPEIIAESLSEEHRSAIGRIHPQLMGGEYLPDLLPNEVEITRVTMDSTTMDVISIRARQSGKRISYRIVDEYMEDGDDRFVVSPRTSSKPLKMKQVIKLIGDNDLIDGPRDMNYDEGCACSPEEIYDFCTVSSAYYPQLNAWFEDNNEDWLEKEMKKRE